MPVGRLRAALSRISLTRALVGLGALLVAINVCSAIWDIRADRERVQQRAQRDFSNLTRLLAEQTAASLEAVDLVLRDAVRDGSAAKAAAMLGHMPEELTQLAQLASIVVLDRNGEVLTQTNLLPTIDPDLSKLALFEAHRDGRGPPVILSEPFLGGPVATSWRFAVSRRFTGFGGAFDGVLAAIMEIDRFERLYQTIDVGNGGFIALLSLDGVMITRVPDPGGVKGRRFYNTDIYHPVRSGGRFDGWTPSPVVDEQVMVSAQAVRGFPLFVATGAPESAVLAPWREQAWLVGLRTLLTSAAVLALIALAAWGLARREQAIARSEKRFRAMIEHSADAMLLTRPDSGGILYVSPTFERLTGYRLDDVRGSQYLNLIHPDHHAASVRQRDETLRLPGKVVVQEVRIRHKDGSWRWVENTISNLLHEPGIRSVVMNLRDITERKLADAERVRLEQRLRQAEKMEAVGRLAGGIAHDFNNILGGILGYAEMLVESTAEGTSERRYARNVLTAATRASSLVEQILHYSRSQRGKRVPVELDRIIAETLELVRGSLGASIQLEARLPDTPLYVVGDPTQLHQIMMNLCTNAIHAMAGGGTLRVSLVPINVEADRVFQHTTLHAGRYARLTVEDTGSGMDSTTLQRLFEPFFTTKEVGKGTGLGLSLVYGIVTDSAGAIEVTSTPGKGSCFAIYLPQVESPVVAGDDAEPPVVRGKGERVLVVDDEEALMALTSETLKRLGYEPSAFPDGAKALAEFESRPERFDVVVTDEVMPGLTGTDLASSLRRRRRDLPIVLVSGYIGPMMSERALAAGVDAILKKPVQSRELAAALARVLKRA
jgi:PAS domain S-box-containing protein